MAIDPSSLDLSRYRTISILSFSGSISVGKSLLESVPEQVPEYVAEAANFLEVAVTEAETALTERLDGKADVGLERSFDILVDRIWTGLRSRLEFWQCYRHDGMALLNEEEQDEAEIEHNLGLTQVAEELLARLFGDGVDFLRLPYPQQAAHMAARLRYIESRGLGAKFVELVGEAPAVLVRVCQRRYEAMVAARTGRNGAVAVDVRPLRAKIRWAAENYASMLLSTLPKGDEQWAKKVLAALQPMIASDGNRAKSVNGEDGEAENADELDLDFESQPMVGEQGEQAAQPELLEPLADAE